MKSKQKDLDDFRSNANEMARLLKAIGNKNRLMLLCALIENKEKTASELMESIGLSFSATSQHLAKMRNEGLIEYRRESQNLYYRISAPQIKRTIMALKKIHCS